MRLGQIEPPWPLPCDTEQRDPDTRGEDPSRCRVLHRLALLVRQRGPMIPERGAHAGLQGRIHQHTPRHAHAECHEARRRFAIPRRGQQLGGFQQTAPTLRLTLALGAVEACRRRPVWVIKCLGGQDNTTRLGAPCRSSRQGGRQRPFHLGDRRCRWGTAAWAPPLAIPRAGTARDWGAWGHLPAVRTGAPGW
jgi:hypothetical protein